jgi:peroxiredoxin family protein
MQGLMDIALMQVKQKLISLFIYFISNFDGWLLLKSYVCINFWEMTMSDEKKLAIIATKGTLDWAYPPFILSSTAAALGYETQIFFTFYGLQLLKKRLDLKVSPLGNPGMPMPLGMDKWFPVLGTAIPGMEAVMTVMMKKKMASKGVASLEDLRELCQEAEVKFIACQMTVDLFDMNHGDFIDNIEFGGAATFFEFAGETDICLYI